MSEQINWNYFLQDPKKYLHNICNQTELIEIKVGRVTNPRSYCYPKNVQSPFPNIGMEIDWYMGSVKEHMQIHLDRILELSKKIQTWNNQAKIEFYSLITNLEYNLKEYLLWKDEFDHPRLDPGCYHSIEFKTNITIYVNGKFYVNQMVKLIL
jgi:hypothetical protein